MPTEICEAEVPAGTGTIRKPPERYWTPLTCVPPTKTGMLELKPSPATSTWVVVLVVGDV